MGWANTLTNNKIMNTSAEWIRAVKSCISSEYVCKPRNLKISENINYTTTIDMKNPLVLVKSRKLSYNFAFAEAYWILSGRNDLKFLLDYAPSYGRFSDDGQFLSGAYGPHVISQLPYIIKCLKKDTDTRQAVMTIWNRSPIDSKDIPCTLSFQFLIRENTLHMVANMRSSDVWLGLPYDLFSFSMIGTYVWLIMRSRENRLQLGSLHLNAGSSHLYENNVKKATLMLDDNIITGCDLSPYQFCRIRQKTGCNYDPELFLLYLENMAKSLNMSGVQ